MLPCSLGSASLGRPGPATPRPLMPLSPLASLQPKLTVNILDVNDNTPQFKPFGITYYTERILEGHPRDHTHRCGSCGSTTRVSMG